MQRRSRNAPNVPATTADNNPNWSLALPLPIEDLMAGELPARIAAELSRKGRSREQGSPFAELKRDTLAKGHHGIRNQGN